MDPRFIYRPGISSLDNDKRAPPIGESPLLRRIVCENYRVVVLTIGIGEPEFLAPSFSKTIGTNGPTRNIPIRGLSWKRTQPRRRASDPTIPYSAAF